MLAGNVGEVDIQCFCLLDSLFSFGLSTVAALAVFVLHLRADFLALHCLQYSLSDVSFVSGESFGG